LAQNKVLQSHFNAHKLKKKIKISDLGSVALSAAQVCYAKMPRLQTDQTCGAHNFHARYKILTQMYWSRQYLSNDPKKSLPRPL